MLLVSTILIALWRHWSLLNHLFHRWNSILVNIRGSIRPTKTFCTGIYSSVTSSLFYEILNSVRKGDWDLFIDAVLRSLPLFFATGRSNYSRWGSLFYQDCLDLQRKFPDLYSHFTKGLFVCHLTKRGGSGIGFDMGLEVTYNFTAKAGGGVIGVTREKNTMGYHQAWERSFRCFHQRDGQHSWRKWWAELASRL